MTTTAARQPRPRTLNLQASAPDSGETRRSLTDRHSGVGATAPLTALQSHRRQRCTAPAVVHAENPRAPWWNTNNLLHGNIEGDGGTRAQVGFVGVLLRKERDRSSRELAPRDPRLREWSRGESGTTNLKMRNLNGAVALACLCYSEALAPCKKMSKKK